MLLMRQVTSIVFTLSDARALGVRKDEIYRRLAAGEIERILT
jgi:hypothetical protein